MRRLSKFFLQEFTMILRVVTLRGQCHSRMHCPIISPCMCARQTSCLDELMVCSIDVPLELEKLSDVTACLHIPILIS